MDDSSILGFHNGYNCVIIEPEDNTIGLRYQAMIRDPVGFGSGNSHEDAARSLVRSLREVADEIEIEILKKFDPKI